jgi:hypothetical protein
VFLARGLGKAVHLRVYDCVLQVCDQAIDPHEMEWKVQVGDVLVITAVRRCYGVTLRSFRWEIHKLSPEAAAKRKRRYLREKRQRDRDELFEELYGEDSWARHGL